MYAMRTFWKRFNPKTGYVTLVKTLKAPGRTSLWLYRLRAYVMYARLNRVARMGRHNFIFLRENITCGAPKKSIRTLRNVFTTPLYYMLIRMCAIVVVRSFWLERRARERTDG